MRKLSFLVVLLAVVLTSGCWVGPKTWPIWVGVRQYNGVEKNYAMNGDDTENALRAAIKSQGGNVRYVTRVGQHRTMYARTCDNEHVVIDIDPYRENPNMTEVDICVGMYGCPEKAQQIYSAMGIEPMKFTKVPEVAVTTDCGEACDK